VRAAHGVLPVPAPATLKILEGIAVKPGPEGAGELVTPTGAALLRIMTGGKPVPPYVPRRSGFGAGTKDFPDRANALRLVLADPSGPDPTGRGSAEPLVLLAADVDDMSPEYLAAAVDRLRAAGALDVTLHPVVMKKGRAASRVEVLCSADTADALEELMLVATTTIGVRRTAATRRALPRRAGTVEVNGHQVRVKFVTRPGGVVTAKPEHDDVVRVAEATGRPIALIFRDAELAAERSLGPSV